MKNARPTAPLLLAFFVAMVALLGVDIDVSTPSTSQTAPNLSARDSKSIRIGVLSHKGADICGEMWQPTMDYLDKALPERKFDLAPLKFEEIESAVRDNSIDFLICNPEIYVDLEVRYGVSRIMTLRNRAGTQIMSEFGGVVFRRADRSDLQGLQDARGQRFAAVAGPRSADGMLPCANSDP